MCYRITARKQVQHTSSLLQEKKNHIKLTKPFGRNALLTSHCTWAASPADNPSSSSAQVLPVLTGFFDGRQQEGQGHLRPRSYVWRTTRKIAAGLSALVSRLHRRTEKLTWDAIRGSRSPHVRATATIWSARHLRTSLSFHRCC